MTLEMKRKTRVRTEPRLKCWKLKEEGCCVNFREEMRQALCGGEELPNNWVITVEVVRETARKVLGMTSGQRKEDKEAWWWNEEVQESIRRKKLANNNWDSQRDEESCQKYKEMQRKAKKDVAKAKEKENDKLYEKLNTEKGEKRPVPTG